MNANRLFSKLSVVALLTLMIVATSFAGDPVVTGTSTGISEASGTTDASNAVSTAVLPAGEDIEWEVLAGGATDVAMSVSYELSGTVGQTFAGYGTSASYDGTHGYWQVFQTEGCCIGMRGDIDLEPNCTPAEQDADIGDLQMLIEHLFISFAPICCTDEADVAPIGGPDGTVDIADLQAYIEYLFITFIPPSDC